MTAQFERRQRLQKKVDEAREARADMREWIERLEANLPRYRTNALALVHHVLQLIEPPDGGCDCAQFMDVAGTSFIHATHRQQNARVRAALERHDLMRLLEYRLALGLSEPSYISHGRAWVLGFYPEFVEAVLKGFCGPKPSWC